MRIQPKPVFVLLLCLWIPVAHSQHISSPPEDQDSSGDDLEFSGSGEEGSVGVTELNIPEVSWSTKITLPASNVTETAWVTDAPVRGPEKTTVELHSTSILGSNDKIPDPVNTTPVVKMTTAKSDAQPSPTTMPPHIPLTELGDLETTALIPEGVEETTVSPEEEEEVPPVMVIEDTTSTSATSVVGSEMWTVTPPEEPTTPSVVVAEEEEEEEEEERQTTPAVVMVEEEDGTTVPVEVVDIADMETTLRPQMTVSTVVDPVQEEEEEESGDGEDLSFIAQTTEEPQGPGLDVIIPETRIKINAVKPDDEDFQFEDIKPSEEKPLPEEFPREGAAENQNLMERKEVLAGVIAGGVVGLAFAVMLVALMIYRMKKKDEGSYALDEHKPANGGYQKPQRQEEFLA
ncbi:syndecan-1-like [Chanos chanos]|uniref:Syndecan n=1 Tax=Chanos chanos TaxID=29144 RepID=A0A6J2VRH3_CHACN|nr:syndecan-1 [Chanos chanos]